MIGDTSRSLKLRTLLVLSLCAAPFTLAFADEPKADPKPAAEAVKQATVAAEATPAAATAPAAAATAAATPTKSKYPPFTEVTKDFKQIDGMIKLYHKDARVYAELTNSHFNKDYIVVISIAKGIGEGSLLAGMSWGFGDDWLWQFRKVDEHIHVVRRNVRFKANANSPEEKAVKLAYTDSILFSLPIATLSPSGGMLVDLSPIFMSDLPRISEYLPGFSFNSSRSTWAQVKGFPENVELQVAATYASSGRYELDSVPDSRGATINVHYSLSAVPNTGYTPRLADDRVGYFLSAFKDFSRSSDQDRFVRYINRWHLKKADPSAELSPPEKPIIFWLEKTIPFKYRAAIREGILEWNKAFEKAGFVNAIEVRQQDDNADWDPEDIRYNTFRWITSGAGFAMGPSRVNPATGQILDADIIFDADFIQFWKTEYENFTPPKVAALTGGALDLITYQNEQSKLSHSARENLLCRCELHRGMSREMALGSMALAARTLGPEEVKQQEKLIMQGLKEVTMHEVGHTLGLRHNFKASTQFSLADLNDPAKTGGSLTASVMDYTPANLVPRDMKQGDYYSTTIGPYDMWAIEYGYKVLSGGTEGEAKELKKIASRAGEPALAFATDEDARGIDPDPLVNRFDFGPEPIEFAKHRAKLISELWPGLVDRTVADGDGYERARQAFGVLLGNYGQAMFAASRNIGGLYVNRTHKGDANAKDPFELVPAAKQRDSLALLEELVFSDKPFQFPPEMYNKLASSRWSHWGASDRLRSDYAVHDVIEMWQDRMLQQVLSPLTLERLHDSELKAAPDVDAFTTAELINRLTGVIFKEVESLPAGEYTPRKPAISSLRRNLQRSYLQRLSQIAMGNSGAPVDCATLAYAELTSLEGKLRAAHKNNAKLDAYTNAHLLESADRIHKVLDARLTLARP